MNVAWTNAGRSPAYHRLLTVDAVRRRPSQCVLPSRLFGLPPRTARTSASADRYRAKRWVYARCDATPTFKLGLVHVSINVVARQALQV
jgi:hypothetical protein